MSALHFTIRRGGRVRWGRRSLSTRLLARAEDAIACLGTIVGTLLVLHMIDRIVFGLTLNGVFA